jgi:diguanylate cyclase (GGDEF)-like protein
MRTSSLTSRIMRGRAIRDWAWWQLPPLLRCYVAMPPVLAASVIGLAAASNHWHVSDLGKFLLLMCCGIISVTSVPKIMYAFPGLTRDFSSIWVLPTAILLPPLYAALVPISFTTSLHLFVHRGVPHRMVFTASSTSLCYAAASWVFRLFPASFAGAHVGTGTHALTWCVAVVACEIIGSRGHHFLILVAVKLSAPQVRIWDMEWDRESLQALLVEIDLGVLITLAVAISPALVLIAVPSVLLVRRFLIFPVLVAQSRVDAKTGLLNVTTWEKEADGELSRSIRMRSPVALALVDIDHFKQVNDTYGHLAGDRVLRAVAEALTTQSRDYDHVGRFGGEEFVLLLAQTGEEDAKKIAQRLRAYIEGLTIPVDDRPNAPTIQITISIGVTAVARGESLELIDLLAAADSAMYHAKQAGRNRVAYAAPARDMGLDAALGPATSAPDGRLIDAAQRGEALSGTPQSTARPLASHQVVLVQVDQAAASLCPRMSLSVVAGRHPESDLAG